MGSLSFSASTTLTASTSVDKYGTLAISVSTLAQSITIPPPTYAVGGKVVNIVNSGSNAFVLTLPALSPITINLAPGAASTIIWNGARWTASLAGTGGQAYLVKMSAAGGAVTIADAITNNGFPLITGNTYTIYNDLSTLTSSLAVTITNGASVTGTSIYNGIAIRLPAYQSMTLTQYSSTDFTYISSSLQTGCYVSTYIASEGNLPTGFDTLLNLVADVDPLGWCNNTTHQITIGRTGYYLVNLSLTAASADNNVSTLFNTQVRVNGVQQLLVWGSAQPFFNRPYNTISGSAVLYLNKYDLVTATGYPESHPITVGQTQTQKVLVLSILS